MNSIAGLIAELQGRGIILSMAGDEIRFRAPKNALTDDDRNALGARRQEIVTFLLAREAARDLRNAKHRAGPFTPSVAQEMWWRFAGGPDEGKPVALNIGTVGHFRDTNALAVACAVRDIVARHDVLRTHIDVQGDQLMFSLNSTDAFMVEERDLSHLGVQEAADAAASQAREYCAHLIPMAGQWLTRACVFALPGNEVVLAMPSSHIIADAGSRNIILDNIQDVLDSKDSPAQHPIAYNDFSLAERDALAGPRGELLIGYWRDWYAKRPALLSPLEKKPLQWGNGPRIVNNFALPEHVLNCLRSLAETWRVTPFMIHLAIFSQALSRWSRTEDFMLRVLGDKRTSLELSRTVGPMFCADAIDVHAPAEADFETFMRGILKEYEASLALRLPTLHFYPPQCVRPGVEPLSMPNRIPAVFNYYSVGTARERAEAMMNAATPTAWPPQVQRLPPAIWPRRSAPVFLHLMDYGSKADASLHFYTNVVTDAEQKLFIDMLFTVYGEVVPS